MEFDRNCEPVTLLHFTSICPDDYNSHAYSLESLANSSSNLARSSGHSMDALTDSAAADIIMSMDLTTSPIPTPTTIQSSIQPPPYGYARTSSGREAFMNAEPNCSSNASYISGQRADQMQTFNQHSQVASPASISMSNSGYDADSLDLDSIEMLLSTTSTDLGPPPIHLPRLEEEPPKKEPAYSCSGVVTPSTSTGNLFASHTISRSNQPHSPINSGDSVLRKALNSRSRGRSSARSPRNVHTVRASSPMFPDQSTPLSSLSRQTSFTSVSSTRSDPISTVPASVRSDPGTYQIQNTTNSCDSAINSPSVVSMQDSPRFTFGSSNLITRSHSIAGSLTDSGRHPSRSCLELEMPVKYARKIVDLDKKILKLQAERSKVLEKAHQTKSSGTGPMANSGHPDIDTWLLTDKMSEVGIGRVHLYVFPLGIHTLDEPLYEEANMILRQVGGLYFDLQSAINNLRNICCKGMFIVADISTCFAFIKSLLHENQKLKLSSTQRVYQIQLDMEALGNSDGMVPPEFTESLDAANTVLRCAQHITNAYGNIQMQLQKVRQIAAGKVEKCESICQTLGIMDRERKQQIRLVLEGNCITMASAERVWPQYYQVATETISIITECIHPST